MSSFVRQSRLFGLKPVVTNNLNIPKPQPGRPALLTFDEVTTLFHEFGHAIHGMLSNVHYPLLSGTAVPRDFVEYPSQYNEMWAREPVVLANFAKHYQTGAAMPQELLNKVLTAQKFNQGYATTEYLAAAMLDQEWHLINAVAGSGRRRCRRLRSGRASQERHRLPGCAAALSLGVLSAHFRRRLFLRVLRVSVERSVGTRHGAMDARTRRPDTRQWRLPARQGVVTGSQSGSADAVP